MSQALSLTPRERQPPFVEAALAICICAIIYTTLQPWVGWRAPNHSIFRYLGDSWPRFWTWFDVIANLAAYLPIGLLLAVRLRAVLTGAGILLACLATGLTLSFVLESLQNFLPTRVPSRLDLVLNASGATLGGALAVIFLQRPHEDRELLWHRPAIFGSESLPLLFLVGGWLLAQFSPQRMLFETGALVSPLVQSLGLHVERSLDTTRPSVEFAAAVLPWLSSIQAKDQFSLLIETASVTLWVSCIGLLLIDSLATHRTRAIAIVLVLGSAFLIRSTALGIRSGSLDFGLWISPGAQAGMLLGPLLLLLAAGLRRRHRLLLALMFALLGILLANILPDNVYQQQMINARSLPEAWRAVFSCFHLLAIVWPFAAVLLITRQLLRHDERWEGIPFMNESLIDGYRRFTGRVSNV